MKFNFPINNFASGEWSPRMMGRTDTDQYARSCEELTNFIPQMTGGAAFRGGTQAYYMGETLQEYLDGYANAGGIVPPFGMFKLVPYTPFEEFDARIIIIGPNKWFTWSGSNEVTYGTAAGASISTWDPDYTRYTTLGDLIVFTNMQGTHKPKVFWMDNLKICHLDDIDNEYVTKQPWKTIPWKKVEALDSNVTLNPSATTGTITITASGSYFVGNDVGSYRRFCNGTAVDGVVRITGVTNATTATATVLQTLPNAGFTYGSTANPASFWQESAWSNKWGWPRTVTAHQGRLIFGGSSTAPDTLWGSRISNYFDFQEVPSPNTTGSTGFASSAFTADNSRPFTLTPNSPEASAIVALSSSKTLTINTQKAEIVAYGSNGALGPVNVVMESSTSYGAAAVQPVRVNNYVTFVQATGRSIRDMVYNFDEDQFKSTDLAFVADHLFVDENTLTGTDFIEELAKTEDTSSLLWTRTSLGKLRVVTLDRDYQVNAWARVNIGSSGEPDQDGNRDARVISICGFPIANRKMGLHALVFRVVNGVGVMFLEAMQGVWELPNPLSYGFNNSIERVYTDCTVIATKEDSLVWSTRIGSNPYSPFRGSTVAVIANGNYIGDYPVANDDDGTLTLEREYGHVMVGWKYSGRLVTSPIEQGGQTGVPMGRQKRINELVIRFFNSLGTSYGKEGDMQEIAFRDPNTPMNAAVQYFTGDKVVPFPTGYDRKCQVVIEQNMPYPCHIVAVIPQGMTYD